MCRPLCALVLVLVFASCGDDDAADLGGSDAATSAVPAAPDGGDVVEAAGGDGSTTTVPTDDPASGAPDDAASREEGRDEPLVFVSDLSAAAAVPPPGDEGSEGRVEVQAAGDGTLCFDMVAVGLGSGATAAHVHRGEAGAGGDVVVGIGPPTGTDGETDTWRDVCVDVDSALVDRIEADPGGHYADIHTETHPRSALRGQLTVASIFDLTLS